MSSVFASYVAAHFPNRVLTAVAIAVLHYWTMLPVCGRDSVIVIWR